MPKYGWKPEFQIPRPKKKVWGLPPDITPRKFLKREQLVKKKLHPQRREPTEDELRILYEREIYRLFNLHASKNELQKQYNQFRSEKVYPGMIRAWLMNSYQGDVDALGMPQGKGSANLIGGLHYEGNFRQGLLHGHGILKWGNCKGNSYEGNFCYNRLLGKGSYNWIGGAKYVGEIFDGLPHGMGIMEGDKGCKYDGCWKNGKREGQGKMTLGKIAVYQGSWKSDKKDGEGHLVFSTGSAYHGSWQEGKRYGPNNTQLQRIILNNKNAHKKAISSHTLALKGKPDSIYAHNYKGDWMRDLPHGSGRSQWIWNDKKEDTSVLKNSYIGSYENGMRHGQGSFFYASGALFKGHWRNNMKVGFGVLVYETGKVHFGIFSHDHYDPIADPGLDIKEPLEQALHLASKEDVSTTKFDVWRAIMRHKNTIQNVFLLYCSIRKELPKPIPTAEPAVPTSKEDKENEKIKKDGKGKTAEKLKMKDKGIKLPKDSSTKKATDDSSKKKRKGEETNETKETKKKLKTSDPSIEEKVTNKSEEKSLIPTAVEEKVPESPGAIAGRGRGMSNEQIWRLLHDGHMLYPGLGCGQVDRMVPNDELAWDSFSDIHSCTRQLILREFVSILIQIALSKYHSEQITSGEKVENFLAAHLKLLEFVDHDSWFAKVELVAVQNVLKSNHQTLNKHFCELLLESETEDFTVKLKALFQFAQTRKPQLDEPSGALISKMALEIYGIHLTPKDEPRFLDQDLNFKEYEVILLTLATFGEDLPYVPEDDLSQKKNKIVKDSLQDSSSGDPLEKTKGSKQDNLSHAQKDKKQSPRKTKEKAKQKDDPNGAGEVEKKSPRSPNSPNSPKSPKSGKSNKGEAAKVKDKQTKETPMSEKEAKMKSREIRAKAKQEYEIALADLLAKFIAEEVGVYKPPKGLKSIDSKGAKGKTPKLKIGTKGGKKG